MTRLCAHPETSHLEGLGGGRGPPQKKRRFFFVFGFLFLNKIEPYVPDYEEFDDEDYEGFEGEDYEHEGVPEM